MLLMLLDLINLSKGYLAEIYGKGWELLASTATLTNRGFYKGWLGIKGLLGI